MTTQDDKQKAENFERALIIIWSIAKRQGSMSDIEEIADAALEGENMEVFLKERGFEELVQ